MRPLLSAFVVGLCACSSVDSREKVDSQQQGLGGNYYASGNCNGWASMNGPCVLQMAYEPASNDIHYEVWPGPPIVGDHQNILAGMVGQGWPQYEMTGGGYGGGHFYFSNVKAGAMYGAQAQSCLSTFGYPDTCSVWNTARYVYAQAPSTHWCDDADQINCRPDAYDSFQGGWETQSDGSVLIELVCSVSYNGGQHVGKYVDGYCFFGWGGYEHYVFVNSMVLLSVDSSSGAGWQWAYGNGLPPRPVAGGYENGATQYICRASLPSPHPFNGYHPGKTLADGCHTSWGGTEYVQSGWYQVLAYP